MMSDPARQMSNRKLPPLPGIRRFSPKYGNTAGPNNTSHSMGRRRDPNHNRDMVITGKGPHSNGTLRYRSSSTEDIQSPHDINSDLVAQYLHENPEFLDRYVVNHVTQERLEKWTTTRKRHPPNSSRAHGSVIVNGDATNTARTDSHRRMSVNLWRATLLADKRKLLQELTKNIQLYANKGNILHELCKCVASVVGADSFSLYTVDEGKESISYYRSTTQSLKPSYTRPIGKGTSLAAYVAHVKDMIRLYNPHRDERFPEGVLTTNERLHAVMAQPMLNSDGETIAVVELLRGAGGHMFTPDDEERVAMYLSWADMILQYFEMYHNMIRQRKLNDFLLTVTKSIFQDIVSMDSVIMKIMNFAQTLVNADRASIFLLDVTHHQLYARIFDVGVDEDLPECEAERAKTEIRFPMDKGVAGHVATTGEILNIPDAYLDDRFNRDVDLQTGYKTKTILCMPIYIRGSIIGVVQMVNKINGTFTRVDEEAFETFAIYCGLALHHAKLYDKIRKSEQKYKVAIEVLSYHSQCSEDEFDKTARDVLIPEQLQSEIVGYDFSPWSIEQQETPTCVLFMFKELFGETRFDLDALTRFTLTVKKNYRNVPYHNWTHAFSVAHAIYTVIKTARHKFTQTECIALYVACLCHDLDHRGKTNAFMVKSASPLAAVYSTSTMEHHHFNQTVTILQHDGHNIFRHLSSEEYKKVLGDIRHCILATDLAMFFGNQAHLKKLVNSDSFSWEVEEHRMLAMTLGMTASDLCAMYKPWKTQYDLVHVIMEEFWQQGDVEKSKGITPMAMMDRSRQDELPQLEVGFLTGICLPCYELMAQILPETEPMLLGAVENLRQWKELADIKAKEKEEKDAAEKQVKIRQVNVNRK